jgi:2-hydroxycyclohexanecarboxyl-CoA dehydrogenase
MDLGLKDKVAVLTGGASGLGLETARYLVREGCAVLLADLNEHTLAAASDELRKAGGRVSSVKIDVRRYEDCERMAAQAVKEFGSIDVVLAGAGISTSGAFFLDTTPKDWDAVLDINIRGVLNTNRACAPIMAEKKSGSIINIASEAGKVGEKRMVVYSATKGAVMSFTKAFALEMGRYNVRVNAVCPGVTRTPMTIGYGGPGDEMYQKVARLYPMGRLGEPSDIAAMITMLASNQTSWVTAQCISVSGGFGRS